MPPDPQITPTSNALPALEDTLVAAVERVIGAADSANTTRAYNAAFAKYCAWCVRRGIAPMPASPAVVATFLVDLAETGVRAAVDRASSPRSRSRSRRLPQSTVTSTSRSKCARRLCV